MLNTVHVIGFDADDTLWHNESLFSVTKERFAGLLSTYHEPDWIDQKLYETEMRNLHHFGYGIKGFTLSMIETAIELTEGRIQGNQIRQMIEYAKEMLQAPVELLPSVRTVIEKLAAVYPLMLITKGDLFDQESKLARSGLASFFTHVEVVTEKNPAIYQALLAHHGICPDEFLMVGNSLRSDVLPVLRIGGRAVLIPYDVTWRHEAAERPDALLDGYFCLDAIGDLPDLLKKLDAA